MNQIKNYLKYLSRLPRQAGFTIVLTIASAIFSITQKQITLASLSQQSQYAFYAADTAAECALYWDQRYSYFATTTPTLSITATPSSPVPPTCDGASIALNPTLSNKAYNLPACYYARSMRTMPCYIIPSTQFPTLNLFGKYCAQITVTKFLDVSTNPSTVHTTIEADGYNVNCTDISTNPNALERSVVLNY
jgi:hypothetical protein